MFVLVSSHFTVHLAELLILKKY